MQQQKEDKKGENPDKTQFLPKMQHTLDNSEVQQRNGGPDSEFQPQHGDLGNT